MTQNFEGKVALVTGAASGIGRAIAKAFAKANAKLILADVSDKTGEAVAQSIRDAGGQAEFVHTDVTKSKDVAQMLQRCKNLYGRLDYACNNAGIDGEVMPLAEGGEDDFDRVIGVNLKGVWLCMKHEIPLMLKGNGGAIVNTSSIMGKVARPDIVPYVAAKHGVLGLTKAAALGYAASGIRVNAVCPGMIRTPMVEQAAAENPDIIAEFEAATPQGRIGTPEEIADAVLWLCSTQSAYVNGHGLVIDGAFLAQ